MPYLWAIRSYHRCIQVLISGVLTRYSTPSPLDPFPPSMYTIITEENGREVPVDLNGIHLLMKLDRGISRKVYSNPPIPACTLTQGTRFKLGVPNTSIKVTLLLLVVEGSRPSLLGRNWLFLVKLNWKKICSIRVSNPGLPRHVKTQLHTTV